MCCIILEGKFGAIKNNRMDFCWSRSANHAFVRENAVLFKWAKRKAALSDIVNVFDAFCFKICDFLVVTVKLSCVENRVER